MSIDYNLLYVSDVAKSVAFYEKILGLKPVASSPGFAVFALPSGNKLGLWLNAEVAPAATAPGGCEFGIGVKTYPEVDQTAEDWSRAGTKIVQDPVDMPFGRTFTALDPDGHRLRVYSLADNPQ